MDVTRQGTPSAFRVRFAIKGYATPVVSSVLHALEISVASVRQRSKFHSMGHPVLKMLPVLTSGIFIPGN